MVGGREKEVSKMIPKLVAKKYTQILIDWLNALNILKLDFSKIIENCRNSSH